MPNRNLVRREDGSWDSTTKTLPSEKEQQKKVVKSSDFLEKPKKSTPKADKPAK